MKVLEIKDIGNCEDFFQNGAVKETRTGIGTYVIDLILIGK